MSLDIARTLRAAYRRNLSIGTRRRVGHLRRVLIRCLDLPFDVLDRRRARQRRLPPARLREQIAGSSSRRSFLRTGERAADEIRRALASHAQPGKPAARWLDLGCGSGRVARHLLADPEIGLTGIDVDRAAIDWCAQHLRGRYLEVSSQPPAPLPDASFDVAFSVSVFTHFDERLQFAWLAELRRLLRPGGLFIASTHAETVTHGRADLSESESAALRSRGFAFRRGTGPFNEDIAFHTGDYLHREWAKYFTPVDLVPAGLLGYLDLSVWRA